MPAVRGERHECYAITEEGAGSDVDAIESTATRDGDEYILRGTKMHVTSYNTADWIFFQAKLAGGDHEGEHALFFVDKDTPGRAAGRGSRGTRTPIRTPTRSSRSRTCGCRPPTSSAPRATGCRSPTSGSDTSG